MSEGDKLFKNEKYAEALGKYESAVQIMRNDAYALKQINLVKDRIAEEKLAKEEKTALLEKYEAHITREQTFLRRKLEGCKRQIFTCT